MEISPAFWYLEKFNLMKKIGRLNLMRLSETFEVMKVKKGEEIEFNFNDENLVYFLKTGAVKIVSKDTNITKSILKRGNIFGEISSQQSTNSIQNKAVALKNIKVCCIQSHQMEILMNKFPKLKNELLTTESQKVKKLERRLEDLLYKDSKTRIKEYLFEYLKEFGEEEKGFLKAENLISHSDIAHLTNTSRQTVNNVMSTLRKENIIDYNSQFITINQLSSYEPFKTITS